MAGRLAGLVAAYARLRRRRTACTTRLINAVLIRAPARKRQHGARQRDKDQPDVSEFADLEPGLLDNVIFSGALVPWPSWSRWCSGSRGENANPERTRRYALAYQLPKRKRRTRTVRLAATGLLALIGG